MPRVALSMEQKKDYKIKDFKGWVKSQMHLNHKTQADVGRVLGISQPMVSQMLKVPDKDKKKDEKIKPDPFTYGQVLALCELFKVDDREKLKLLTL